MSAARKLAQAASVAHHGRFLPQLAGRDLTSRPAISSQLTLEQCQYAEKVMRTYTRRITVNPDAKKVNLELAMWAKSAPAKVLALRTGISKARIYDWRSERFGANAATMEIVRRDRINNARAQIEQAKAVIRQSLGDLAEVYPDAVNKILEG